MLWRKQKSLKRNANLRVSAFTARTQIEVSLAATGISRCSSRSAYARRLLSGKKEPEHGKKTLAYVKIYRCLGPKSETLFKLGEEQVRDAGGAAPVPDLTSLLQREEKATMRRRSHAAIEFHAA